MSNISKKERNIFFIFSKFVLLINMTVFLLIFYTTAMAAHFEVVLDYPVLDPANIMDISGTLTLNHQTRAGDEIGVFFNGKLCGACQINKGDGSYSMHIFNKMVVVNGPQAGSTLQVKIWDNQKQVELFNNITLDILDPQVKDASGHLIWKENSGSMWGVNISYILPVEITSVSPNKGYSDVNTEITIKGNNFSQGVTVKIGSIELSPVTFIDAGTIKATIPAGLLAIGVYGVTIIREEVSGTLNNSFEICAPVTPSITNILPNSGKNDQVTTINILGQNLLQEAEVKLIPVNQGGGEVFLVNLVFYSTNYITADVPTGVMAGIYSVALVNPGGGTVIKANSFTVEQGAGVEITLSPGLNLLSYPVMVPSSYFSYNFFAEYFTPQVLNSLYWYNNQGDKWEKTLWGEQAQPAGDNFPILNEYSYLLYSKEEKNFFLSGGAYSGGVNLYQGMNLVSFRFSSIDYNSYDLFQDLWSDQGEIVTLKKYDKDSGRWQVTHNLFGQQSGDKFNIKKEESYIIFMKNDKIAWTF